MGPQNDDIEATGETHGPVVLMQDNLFAPRSLTVAAGATVTWRNADAVAHSVTPTDKAACGSEGTGDAPSSWVREDGSWSFTFQNQGRFPYYCIPHAYQTDDGTWHGMVGAVVVT